MQVRNLLRGWRVDVIHVSKKKKWDKRVFEKDDEAAGGATRSRLGRWRRTSLAA